MARRSYGQECPVARSLDILGERWTLLIIHELLNGEARFSELSVKLSGIPSNLLSARLKTLEEIGLVRRTLYSNHPPRAYYGLTEAGEALRPVLEALHGWGLQYGMRIRPESAREAARRIRAGRRRRLEPHSLSA
ncbi:MAG TPA: helix-turn-helix domain-containing protein [Dehalococcoidia bacterium]|nr:helix-turn-helix domain-containing protein [Dehalococcoidia bacterium]